MKGFPILFQNGAIQMKKVVRILVPVLMAALVIGSIGWYLFVYDRGFTRDVLLEQARYNDTHGNARLSSWFYNLAYMQSGQDPNVAIELANQYIRDGNYTKAEVTLTNAIHRGATAELYCALSQTFVEQDKLMDAVALLENISDPAMKAQLEAQRPEAPAFSAASGLYTERIQVELSCPNGTVYYSTNGEYPSVAEPAYSEPIQLDVGETKVIAISVAENGLVSPLAIVGYTVGGIVEPATFADPAVELAVREMLSLGTETTIYTNDLWNITELTFPAEANSLEDLALMPYLRVLTIDEKSFESLAPLSNLKQLVQLNLTHCKFPTTELEVIGSLPELSQLTMSNCSLSTIAGLENATKLTVLDLSNNTIRNLEPLENLTGLTRLNMAHNALTNLSSLSGLSALDTLDVSYNALTTLAPLASCLMLTDVDAGNNRLTTVEGVAGLPLLTTLCLDSNSLTNLSPLSDAVGLTQLRLSRNQVSDLSPLAGLVNLELLDFSYNSVEELPQWPEGLKLRVIDGTQNALTNIDVLKNASELTYVYMDYNQIENIDALAELFHLVQVNVYNNLVSDVSKLTDHNILVNYTPVT